MMGRPRTRASRITIKSAVDKAGSDRSLSLALGASVSLVYHWRKAGRQYIPVTWVEHVKAVYPELG